MTSAAQIAARAPVKRKKKGMAHTPSIEELYGPLEKQGIVKIVRKKGCAPKIVWL